MQDQNERNQEGISAPAAEDNDKIERMDRIRQSLAQANDGENPQNTDLPKPAASSKQLLDVSVEDKPPKIEEDSEATRARKVAQIREALSMVERTPASPPQPAKKNALPPLRKKGTKNAIAKNAAAETVAVPQKKQVKTAPPMQQKPKSAAAPVQNPASKLPPLKKAPIHSTAPEQKAAAPAAPVKQPLPALRKAGTVKAAAAPTKAAPAAKPAAKPQPKPTKEKASAEPKKPLPIGKISAILGSSLGGALLIAYVIMACVYLNKFLPNTYINNIDVSGMSKEEAYDALMAQAEVEDLILVTSGGENVSFAPQEYDASYSMPDGGLDEAFSENRFLWIGKLFKASDYTIEYDLSYSERAMLLRFQGYGWGNDPSKDAYIEMNPGTGLYEIVPETIGDRFDKNVLTTYVGKQLANRNFTIDMVASGCYDNYLADIKAEDLTEHLELSNKYVKCAITFDFSDRKEVLDGATIASWVYFTEDSETAFNRAMVENFVAGMAAKYDTRGKDLKFRSTLDGIITVPYTSTSLYGWQIDQEATTEQILELLRTGESATVEPVYRNEAPANVGIGYCRDEATGDIGKTYIEVDISAQHLWYYKNGIILMESDCVTGIDTNPDRRTPRGVFKIWSHEKNRVLGQMDDEGYETFVNYWMPINYIGVGLHDAVWQSSFGGTRYLTGNGSHGCINLPLGFTKNLFNATENGIPVIVHD